MKIMGRVAALCMAFLFVILLPCAAWTFSVGQMALNADTYRNALADSGAYSELIPALLPVIINEEGDGALTAAIDSSHDNPEFAEAMAYLRESDELTLLNVVSNLNADDWATIAELLIPADWLQEEVETNLDAFFAWLNNETPSLDVAFDSGSLRDRLSGEPGQRAVNLIIASWPACTDDQVGQLESLLNSEQGADSGSFPFCQPPGAYLAFTSFALSDVLRQAASDLPDVLPAPGTLDTPRAQLELAEMRRTVRIGQAVSLELWLMPVALLALIVFFTVRSLKSFGRWSGAVLIIGGVFTLLPVPFVLSPFSVSSQMMTMVESDRIQMGIGADFGQAQAYVATIFESLARSITGAFTLPLLIVAALLIGAGFVALIVAALARDPKEIDAGEVYALAASGLVSMPGVTPTPTLTPTVPDADHTPPDFPTPESPPPTRTLPPAPANVPPGDTPENDVPADEEDWSFP